MKDIIFLIKIRKEGKLELLDASEEIGQSYLNKSESNLASAKILFENDKIEETVSLAYYSAYNLLLSLLFKTGIKSENHLATIILLKEIFDFDNSIILSVKEERIKTQYYVDFDISKEQVIAIIREVEDFNGNFFDFISKLTREKIDFYRNKFINMVQF